MSALRCINLTPLKMGRPQVNPVRMYFKYEETKDVSLCQIGDCIHVINGNHPGNLEKHVRRFHNCEYMTLQMNKRISEEESRIDMAELGENESCLSRGSKRTHPAHAYFAYDEETDRSTCIIDYCLKVIIGNHGGNLAKHIKSRHPDQHALVSELRTKTRLAMTKQKLLHPQEQHNQAVVIGDHPHLNSNELNALDVRVKEELVEEVLEPIEIVDCKVIRKWLDLQSSAGFASSGEFCEHLLSLEESRQRKSWKDGVSLEPVMDEESSYMPYRSTKLSNLNSTIVIEVGHASKPELVVAANAIIPVAEGMVMSRIESTGGRKLKDEMEKPKPENKTPFFITRGRRSNAKPGIRILPIRNSKKRQLSFTLTPEGVEEQVQPSDSLENIVEAVHDLPDRSDSMDNDWESDSAPAAPFVDNGARSIIYPCKTCGLNFRLVSLLSAHQALHAHSRDQYKCAKCELCFTSDAELTNHITRAHQRLKQYPCAHCDECFVSLEPLKKHVNQVHLQVRPYACSECPKAFYATENLRKHVRKVHERKQGLVHSTYVCEHCGETFKDLEPMLKHVNQEHLKLKPFSCEVCFKSFYHKSNLRHHTRKVHKKMATEHPCPECDQVFNALEPLKVHKNMVHLKVAPYTCDDCGKAFYARPNLRRHKSRVHQAAAEERKNLRDEQCSGGFVCCHCGKMFQKKEGLKAHEAVHSDMSYPCHVCGQTFKSQQRCKHHYRNIHDPARRKHACEECGKKFLSTGTLECHRNMVHLKVKPYSCEMCFQPFYVDSYLRGHIRTVHYDENAPQFECNKCDKKYLTSTERDEHLAQCQLLAAAHTNTKHPVVCDVCGRTFRSRKYLNSHQVVHTGQHDFACAECGKTFMYRASMQYHYATVHGSGVQKTHKCTECDLAFMRKFRLSYHMLRKHNIAVEAKKRKFYRVPDKKTRYPVALGIDFKPD